MKKTLKCRKRIKKMYISNLFLRKHNSIYENFALIKICYES